MPNEGPYGGKIEIQEDGSVEWQAAARSFPRTQDIEGALEYAIRVTTSERVIVGSKDGKCIVHIHPTPSKGFNVASGAVSAMLIVSGYEEPDEEDGAVVVGKSYFVTGAYRDEGGRQSNTVPCYDIHLKFDDYDLDRANSQIAHLAQQVDEKQLTFCYQRWVSVRFIQEHFKDADKVASHLLSIGASARNRRQLPTSVIGNDDEDIWLSFWNEVRPAAESRCDPAPDTSDRVAEKDLVHEPQLHHHDDAVEGLTIDGIIVSGKRAQDIPGSRTVIVKGIDRPGTFALMYHWKRHVDDHDHSGS